MVGTVLGVDTAIAILGRDKVVTYDQATEKWGIPKTVDPPIRYLQSDLVESAAYNTQGGTDWRLVYAHSLDLPEQRRVLGVDWQKSQPCFYRDDRWIHESDWPNPPQAGYYLVNLTPLFGGVSWDEQNRRIAQLGEYYERADEAVVAQAVLSASMINGERLLSEVFHWGRTLTSKGRRVALTGGGKLGIFVGSASTYGSDSLQVCLSRKWRS